MEYNYFISYAHGNNVLGFGNMQVSRDEPFTNVKQIQEIGHALTRDGISQNVTILSVFLLEPEKSGDVI